jgi:hypothetical protein
MSAKQELAGVWDGVLRAVGTEPRPVREIKGQSGVTHHLLALGVDDTRNRVVVITDEPTPRHAAMMQVDLAATMEGTRVSVARVIPFDLPTIARGLVTQFGGIGTAFKELKRLQDASKAIGAERDAWMENLELVKSTARNVGCCSGYRLEN